MQSTIKVIIKNNYGVDNIYPVCDTAKLLARLAGTKTLTRPALTLIKQMGFTIETVITPVEVF